MMGIKEFASKVKEKLIGMIEGVKSIDVTQVLKNNSVSLCGLVFMDEVSNVTPTIYLEPFYEEYKKGVGLDVLAEQVVASYEGSRIKKRIDFEFFKDWDNIKSHVAYKVINKGRNEELLQKIPHKDVLDLAKVFYVLLEECGGTILIYNSHLDLWRIDVSELEAAADENISSLCPMELKSMGQVIAEMLEQADTDFPFGMYILSNRRKINGAAVMLYPGSMELVADRLQSDFYVLPSSVHETIILPAKEAKEPEQLISMVREVNSTMVCEEEILGDNVYFYDRTAKELKMVA